MNYYHLSLYADSKMSSSVLRYVWKMYDGMNDHSVWFILL